MASLYCWGNTAHGELGLGGIEEEQVCTPRPLEWAGSRDIVDIACGLQHTLLLTGSGQVYSCGNNDHGQLGQSISRKRPQLVSELANYNVRQVCCGAAHSVALNEWGQCFVWGSNSRGQLAKPMASEAMCEIPKLVKQLATRHVVQIASGLYHTMALTDGGELFAWGSNAYGQLGLGEFGEPVSQPTLVTALCGVPVAFIACGGNHSFVVSKSGAVFSWGKNLFGQLGINTTQNQPVAVQLSTLRNRGVRYIACGDDFSVFLTLDGNVYTCGSGTYGQLGHGTMQTDMLPRAVLELMGTQCTQISCGGRHTLVFVPSRGRIYGFGLGGAGQLGVAAMTNASLPQVVRGPWLSTDGQDSSTSKPTDLVVRRIFSGGDQSFMSAVLKTDGLKEVDCRYWKPVTQIHQFTAQMAENCASIEPHHSVDQDLLSQLETIFRSLSCLNASFQLDGIGSQCCNSRHSNVDLPAAQLAFGHVARIEHETLKQIIFDGIVTQTRSLPADPSDYETMRFYLVVPLYHEFANAKHYVRLHMRFARAVLNLKPIPAGIVDKWWCSQPVDYFERLVDVYKGVVVYILQFVLRPAAGQQTTTGPMVLQFDPHLKLALQMMLKLFRLNRRHRIDVDMVPCVRFHFPGLDELVNMQHDYLMWLMDRDPLKFYLCDYPFLFDARTKTLLLQTDQSIQMNTAMQKNVMLFAGIPIAAIEPFIVLRVRREFIVEDTLREIQKFAIGDLKRPLRVMFDGEEAEDAGGVRKEFFLLLLRDLLDPKYGMFREYEGTRAIWFAEMTFEDNIMFMLIGALCGLAIYNFTIIDLPFPLVLYKKLLDDEPDLSDLADLTPTVARSLQSLLDYEGDDFEDVFGLTFELSREVFGETMRVPLVEGGAGRTVTQENKFEYVDLYVNYMLSTSVERQFNGFKDGFLRVCGGKVMALFEAHELMAVVIGNEDYDWHVLEECSAYKNGYTSGDPTIRLFWEVFHELPLAEKKKFLLFLTGSDRIPIQGMKAIKLYFQPTSNEQFLPVAHTCFNMLDLPRYQTKERLKFKLLQAIEQTLGFSLV